MNFETIRRVVLAAIILPFVAMMAEGILLIHSSFEHYSAFKTDRNIADLLARGGVIASTELPEEMQATRDFLREPNVETSTAMMTARKALDQGRRDFFDHLPPPQTVTAGVGQELSRLKMTYSRIIGLRAAVDAGRYASDFDADYIYHDAALKQLGMAGSLSALIQDPVLLRKSGDLISLLLTYRGETIVDALGIRYMEGGSSTMSHDQLIQGDIVQRAGMDRLRFRTYSPTIREVLAFLNRPEQQAAEMYTRAMLSDSLRPNFGVGDSWIAAQQSRLSFLRSRIFFLTDDLRVTGRVLSARSDQHVMAVVGLSVVLLSLVAIVVILATKGLHLVGRLTREREDLVQELRSAAQTDLLTGLYNRRGFDSAVKALVAQAASGSRWFSVVLFDLDHFKQINDVHGHDAGDVVLRQIALIARQTFRSFDLLVRHGGEEFMALLPDSTPEEAATIAEAVRKAIETTSFDLPAGKALQVTASFGCAGRTHSSDLVNFEDLVKKADLALYAAKAAGRNQVVVGGTVPRSADNDRRSKPA